MFLQEWVSDLYTSGKGVWRLAQNRMWATGLWSALPTAAVDYRDALAMTHGATGVADTLSVCRKNAADAYEWTPLGQHALYATFLTRSAMNDTATDYDWTNMPASATVMRSTFKRKLDLSRCTQVRLTVDVAVVGAAGADIYLRYSTDDSSYSDITNATVTIDSTGTRDSGWIDLPAAVTTVVWVQVWGKDGNGAADPRFNLVAAQFR